MQPHSEMLRTIGLMVSSELSIPVSYLGIIHDNPASADAIMAGEARLVKRAERRQVAFGRAWHEVGRLSLLVRDGFFPDDYDTAVTTSWRDANTPTQAASADAAVKLIGAGVLPADSTITYDRIGLTPAEQRIVAADKVRATERN